MRQSTKREAASPARCAAPPSAKKATPEKRSRSKLGKSAQSEKENEVLSKKLSGVQIRGDEKEAAIEKMEVFQDETQVLAGSAVEAYFMQGKSAAERMNKARVRRGRRAAQPDENLEEEEDPDAEKTKFDSTFLQCNLSELRDYITDKNSSEKTEALLEKLEDDFPKWTLYLATDFNILLHGVGSKREVLSRYAKSELSQMTTLRIDARKEDSTFRAMLSSINDNMKLSCNGKGYSTHDWATLLARRMEKNGQQIILLVDNIEAAQWRNDQEALCALLSNRKIVKLVATVDHVYSTLIWNSRQLSTLCLLHIKVDTYMMPLQELLTGESRILGLDSRASSSIHTFASLDVLWKSLSANTKKLFRLLFDLYYETKKPISFWDLFSAAKDDFLVSTDAALRQHLVEFKDHRVVKWTRSDDGNDQLTPIVDKELIVEFLNKKNMPLDHVQ